MTPQVLTLQQWLEIRTKLKGPLGFVPTMGALHEGHLQLVRRSLKENAATLVSIFVNPTQFNDAKDLEQYPRTLDSDIAMLSRCQADFVLAPSAQEMYPDHFTFRVEESEISKDLCGTFRPGHFSGMLTVVLKLLNIAGADRAYFGEKDFQQLILVKEMVKAFFLKTEIIPCPTVREEDGLAMSSRNSRLNAELRPKAAHLFQALKSTATAAEAALVLKQRGFEVEYVKDRWNRRLVAARIGGVRLIDNVELAP